MDFQFLSDHSIEICHCPQRIDIYNSEMLKIYMLFPVNCANNNDTSESNAGAIAGGIIGGLIVLVGIISLVIVYRRRRGYGV